MSRGAVRGLYTGEVESALPSEIILAALRRGSTGAGGPGRNLLRCGGEVIVPAEEEYGPCSL